MTLEQALAVYAHYYHITPLNARESALLAAAKDIIRESALQSLNRRT